MFFRAKNSFNIPSKHHIAWRELLVLFVISGLQEDVNSVSFNTQITSNRMLIHEQLVYNTLPSLTKPRQHVTIKTHLARCQLERLSLLNLSSPMLQISRRPRLRLQRIRASRLATKDILTPCSSSLFFLRARFPTRSFPLVFQYDSNESRIEILGVVI